MKLCIFMAALLLTIPARADRSIQLDYQVAEADLCPDRATLQAAVAARLGYDPFVVRATRRAQVTVERKRRGLRALVTIFDQQSSRVRTLDSESADCQELSQAITLTLSIAIDPQVAWRKPAPSPLPPPSVAISARPEPALRQAQHERGELVKGPAFRLAVGGGAALGTVPGATADLLVGVGLGWQRFSIDVEAHVDLPQSANFAGHLSRVQATQFVVLLSPCFRQSLWRQDRLELLACGTLSAGALWGRGSGGTTSQTDVTPAVGAGARLGIESHLGKIFSARLHGGLTIPFTRSSLRINDADVWTTPRVAGEIGLSFLGVFR